MKSIQLIICSCLIGNVLQAQIIHVPADFSTIKQGIDAANTGDTVLVSPGTYVENINFIGKNITVASLFLTTQDTSFISQTIIDGSHMGSVVLFWDGEDSTALLAGFTITNGVGSEGHYNENGGGGILCTNHSSPSLRNLIITRNSTQGKYSSGGGGICCIDGSGPSLTNITIANNHAFSCYLPRMGGYYPGLGGGISCDGSSNPVLNNVTISGNSSDDDGGGLYCVSANPVLKNVTITGNTSKLGGGIFCSGSTPLFDSINRCNIYLNVADKGNDLYSNTLIEVIVDTFTVLNPIEFHASPITNFSFDILHGYHEQVKADLYVSPTGDNLNSGLIANQPLKNINAAQSFMLADSLNPHTIHLLEGTFSRTSNGEVFPVKITEFISLAGVSDSLVILNSEGTSEAIRINNNFSSVISGMSVTGGSGSGISCSNSDPVLRNLTISNNGNGISCSSSNPIMQNIVISNNNGSGIACSSSSPILQNLFISNNNESGIVCNNFSSPDLSNVTITGNSGGGIFCSKSIPSFDSINRCNIYLNSAFEGNDLYSDTLLVVFVDTFSVLNPNEFHAAPISNFTFDIQHGYHEQMHADLFVSPDGNNNNRGLTRNESLKTIHSAFSFILSDSLNPHTIHLARGTYSPSSNGEAFPVKIPEFIILSGESDTLTILNAVGTLAAVWISNNFSSVISGMTISGGSFFEEGTGIYCTNSNLTLKNVIITGNSTYYGNGGAFYCKNSKVILEGVTISGNGGVGLSCYNSIITLADATVSNNSSGGISFNNSNSKLYNVTISNNNGSGLYSDSSCHCLRRVTIANNSGNGIDCNNNSNLCLNNVAISNNTGSGIVCNNKSSPKLINTTISGNSSGISTLNSSPTLVNSILWNNSTTEIYSGGNSVITIKYSDIRGGEEGINIQSGDTILWMDGNMNEDPLFAGEGTYPFMLTSESPCRNAGTSDTTGLHLPVYDLAGSPRIWDNRIDMGAYEWSIVGIDDFGPDSYRISAYPNPFTSSTTFSYTLAGFSHVNLCVFDSYGRLVGEPVNAFQQKGAQRIEWNAGNLPAGIYFYRLTVSNRQTANGTLVVG